MIFETETESVLDMENLNEVQEPRDEIVEIAESNMDDLNRRVAKVNKRAAKNGLVNFLSYEIVKSTDMIVYMNRNGSYEKLHASVEQFEKLQARSSPRYKPTIISKYVMHSVKMIGKIPVIEGWEFCGTLQHVGCEVVLRIIEGKSVPDNYKQALSTNCDHCNHKRMRNDTYVIRNLETGEFKQIGSKCLVNYFNRTNPAQLAWLARWAGNIKGLLGDEEGGYREFRSKRWVFANTFVAACSYLCQEVGYVSRKAAEAYAEKSDGRGGLQTTADRALDHMTAWPSDNDYAERNLPLKNCHHEDAEKIRHYLTEIKGEGDFFHNLRVISKMEMYEVRELGTIAAGAMMYYKEIQRLEEREINKAKSENKFIGDKGDKIEVKAKIVFTKACESFYGTSLLIKFSTVDGMNSLSTFYSGDSDWDEYKKLWESGEIVTIKATVKGHQVYNEQNTTVLTRVRIVKEK